MSQGVNKYQAVILDLFFSHSFVVARAICPPRARAMTFIFRTTVLEILPSL